MSTLNDTLIIKEAMENTPTTAPVESTSEDVEKPNICEFNRVNIDSLVKKGDINMVDTDDDHKLDMFCYVKCDDSNDDIIKKCRGVVFNGETIVMKAFPYTTEYNNTEMDNIGSYLHDFQNWNFYESHEGALIRLFFYENKWFVSTHRKLNAFKSKWASQESFGTLFKNALLAEEENNTKFKDCLPDGENIIERFRSTLDKNKQYMFLVRNTSENRIVCSPPDRSTVYHVGTFVEGELVLDENINIPHPKQLTFTSVEDLCSHVNDLGFEHIQGVIGMTADNRQVKIVNNDYQDLFNVRGNEPSIKFRYLQVRMNSKYVDMLYYLYPNMADVFDDYENMLYDIALSIYNSYVTRFIKKTYNTVPRDEFAVIRECHSWHISNRSENRISLEKVINVLNQQSPTHLNHMIRRCKLEKFRQPVQSSGGGQFVSKTVSNEMPMSPLRLPVNKLHMTKQYDKKEQTRVVTILKRQPLYKPKTEATT